MKIALCMSGYVGYTNQFKVGSIDSQDSKPLPIEIAYKTIKKYLIQDYDVDTYVHSWDVEREKDILDTYKPKKCVMEKQKGEEDGILDSRYSQWYSRGEVLNLALKSKIKYDFYMLTRFDLAFGINFPFDKLDNKNLYVAGAERWTELNDVYFLSGAEMMKHISKFFSSGLGNYKVGNQQGNYPGGAHWEIGKYCRDYLRENGGKVCYIGSDAPPEMNIAFVRNLELDEKIWKI